MAATHVNVIVLVSLEPLELRTRVAAVRTVLRLRVIHPRISMMSSDARSHGVSSLSGA